MGFLDDLLPGGSPTYKQPPIDVEGVVGTWTAARTMGGVSATGGQLVLGRDWLVFSPWDLDRTRSWLTKWLAKAGVPHVGDVDKLITASGLLEPVAIPVSAVTSAQVLSRGSLTKPPQARLLFADGRHFDVGILWSPTTWNPSPKNRVAFDDFLSKLPVPVS